VWLSGFGHPADQFLTMEDYDMSRLLRLCQVFSLFSVMIVSVEAAPIRVTVVGSRTFNADTNSSLVPDGVMAQMTLPDDFSSKRFGMDWVSPPTWATTKSGGHMILTFIFDRLAEGSPAAGSPSVTIRGILQNDWDFHESPRASYSDMSLKSLTTSLANWSADSDIPRSVIDSFLNPQDAKAFAYRFSSSDPFTVAYSFQPVPEPATLAVWGLVGMGTMAVRRRRQGRPDTASAL
jgi:hypothetical protein